MKKEIYPDIWTR